MEKKEEQLIEIATEQADLRYASIEEHLEHKAFINGFLCAKQYHYSNDSVDVVHFKCSFPNCMCTARCTQFYQDQAHLQKQQESDAVEFAEWCASLFQRSYPKGVDEAVWYKYGYNEKIENRHYTTQELYTLFKSNNNGNT